MEDLRFIPLLMFFGGILLIYSGFQDTTPLAMIRAFLSANTTGTVPSATVTNTYTPNTDPFYAGVTTLTPMTYVAPTPQNNPTLYPGTAS